ncbi:unnamed protein product, partial [Choristocarpus tenellus]
MGWGGDVPCVLANDRIPLHRMIGGVSMHLPGPSPSADPSLLLHVSGFPSKSRTIHIIRPLRSLIPDDSAKLSWIDDTSAILECGTKEGAARCLTGCRAA